MQDDAAGDPPPTLLIVGLVIGVTAIVAILAIAATRQTPPPPVAIAAVPAPQANSPECQALLATLPDQLGDLERATAAEPVPAGTAAWRNAGEPVIMRCGLDRPTEFVVGSPIQMVDDVGWFRLADAGLARSTWVSVDRPVYVALTLPDGSGPTPIQALSEVIGRTMPAIPIRPAR
ncbi:MAG: DUF3515 domain-containing protein [Mycobacterium sp.]